MAFGPKSPRFQRADGLRIGNTARVGIENNVEGRGNGLAIVWGDRDKRFAAQFRSLIAIIDSSGSCVGCHRPPEW